MAGRLAARPGCQVYPAVVARRGRRGARCSPPRLGAAAGRAARLPFLTSGPLKGRLGSCSSGGRRARSGALGEDYVSHHAPGGAAGGGLAGRRDLGGVWVDMAAGAGAGCGG